MQNGIGQGCAIIMSVPRPEHFCELDVNSKKKRANPKSWKMICRFIGHISTISSHGWFLTQAFSISLYCSKFEMKTKTFKDDFYYCYYSRWMILSCWKMVMGQWWTSTCKETWAKGLKQTTRLTTVQQHQWPPPAKCRPGENLPCNPLAVNRHLVQVFAISI